MINEGYDKEVEETLDELKKNKYKELGEKRGVLVVEAFSKYYDVNRDVVKEYLMEIITGRHEKGKVAILKELEDKLKN